MHYLRYGIEMERLHQGHLEQVRRWRNQKFIRNVMQFQDEISSENQIVWFNKLDPKKNWYFVAYFERKPIGLFHIKNIDWSKNFGESGGFVADQRSIGSVNIGLAILALMEFAFLALELEWLVATYHPEFSKIEELNRQLGYEKFETSDRGYTKARITKEKFYHHTQSFRKAAEQLRGKLVEVKDPDEFLLNRFSGSMKERFI